MGANRVREVDESKDDVSPNLFETKKANKVQLVIRWLFLISTLISICMVWFYRFKYVPTSVAEAEDYKLGTRRWIWIGLFAAETWFGFYWILSQPLRLRQVFRCTFRDRLLLTRYEEKLPRVDVFVCTANPVIEPPAMVINTVLSVMAYDYPPEKLSAMLEASHFCKYWIPFCKKFQVEPRSPVAYFSSNSKHSSSSFNSEEWSAMKILYEKMENRIETATKLGKVPDEMRARHKGFSEWDSVSSPRDHLTILQILIDSRTPDAVDMEGSKLPTLVYMAQEKRPQHHHNFKAGAMNSLDFPGQDGNGGPVYIGSGCFHRRETLLGKENSKASKTDQWETNDILSKLVLTESIAELEDSAKDLANCNYEENTQWGNEMGLKYGCPVEDALTGLTIQCRGWKSVYLNPERQGFLGVAPNTLGDTLVQHKRCLPTLYYLVIPPLCLLKGIPLFPKITSPWFLPFAYLIISTYTYSLVEFLLSGGTLQGWWNEQRIWIYSHSKTSYLFGIIDSIGKLLGLSKSEFIITYEKEIMEFGTSSPIFTTIIATIALINLFDLVGGLKRVFIDMKLETIEQTIADTSFPVWFCSTYKLTGVPRICLEKTMVGFRLKVCKIGHFGSINAVYIGFFFVLDYDYYDATLK
ncbi:hypothetical protein MKW92_016842 [Papaver armeniacum]|nr:hypothetical protein MKW92_016842 [Papaver armeniacum]